MKDILFLVKIGKKENLKKMVAGSLYCSPSQKYVLQEKEQHDRGQGDLLEGKMKIRAEGGYIEDAESNKKFEIPKGTVFVASIEDVNNMPVFCMTYGTTRDCINYVSDHQYTIKFSKEYENEVRQSFKEADSALIIYQPEIFISNLVNTLHHQVAYDKIHYFDYDIIDMGMLHFLMGEKTFEKSNVYSMSYSNRYRHLLCKHVDFKEQREFRIIILDDMIMESYSYPYSFVSKYEIIDLDSFFGGVEVCF